MSATTAPEPAVGFEGLSTDQLEERRKAVASDWSALYQGLTGQNGNGDAAQAMPVLSAEDQNRADSLRATYDNIVALQAASAPKPKPTPVPEPHRSENIYEGLKGKALDAQVRRDALTHRNLMLAAKNRYAGEDNLKGFTEHPGEVVLGQPLIARNPVTGYNEVLPIPFVAAEAGDDEDAYLKSLEASFRYGEIVRAGKEGDYDAKTGNRLSRLSQAAQLQAQADTGDINLTSVGGDLYAEMVRRDTFMSVCKIQQVPNLNQYKATGRTAIPTATAVAEDGAIVSNLGDTWRNIDVDFKKYGIILQYTHETTQVESAWSMGQLLAMDAGTAVRNGFNQDLLTAAAGGNTLDGFIPTIKANAAYRTDGGPNGDFPGGITVTRMASISTSIPKEYMTSPNKRLVMSLATWTGIMGRVDTDMRKLFRDSNMSVDDLQLAEYNVRVVLDDNLEAGSATGQIPMLFGDMQSFCVILAGGPRMDFSTEFGFANDRLALRVIQHVGSAIVDTKGFKGVHVS